jgi:hypothetical protein
MKSKRNLVRQVGVGRSRELAMPRPCTSALQTFLDNWTPSTGAQIADLYIFTLITGEVLYYSGFQTPLVAPMANTSSPLFHFQLGPSFQRTKVKTQVGPQIDELEVAIIAGENDLVAMSAGGTLTWQKAFWSGIFDGAYVELLRAFISVTPGIPAGRTVVGTLTWFYGRVGDVEIGRTRCLMRVKNLLDLLTVQMPRRLFQSACNHVFGAPMCGFDRETGISAIGNTTAFGAQTITCGGASTQNSLTTTYAPAVSTAYDNGTMIGLTGLNAGFTRTIGKLDAGVIYFLKPWIFPVVAGVDTFKLLAGCDKLLETCTNTFQNQASDGSAGRYGGFPYIPPPESAV